KIKIFRDIVPVRFLFELAKTGFSAFSSMGISTIVGRISDVSIGFSSRAFSILAARPFFRFSPSQKNNIFSDSKKIIMRHDLHVSLVKAIKFSQTDFFHLKLFICIFEGFLQLNGSAKTTQSSILEVILNNFKNPANLYSFTDKNRLCKIVTMNKKALARKLPNTIKIFSQLHERLFATNSIRAPDWRRGPVGTGRPLHKLAPPGLKNLLEINLGLARRLEQASKIDRLETLVLGSLAEQGLLGPRGYRLAGLVLVVSVVIRANVADVIVVIVLELGRLQRRAVIARLVNGLFARRVQHVRLLQIVSIIALEQSNSVLFVQLLANLKLLRHLHTFFERVDKLTDDTADCLATTLELFNFFILSFSTRCFSLSSISLAFCSASSFCFCLASFTFLSFSSRFLFASLSLSCFCLSSSASRSFSFCSLSIKSAFFLSSTSVLVSLDGVYFEYRCWLVKFPTEPNTGLLGVALMADVDTADFMPTGLYCDRTLEFSSSSLLNRLFSCSVLALTEMRLLLWPVSISFEFFTSPFTSLRNAFTSFSDFRLAANLATDTALLRLSIDERSALILPKVLWMDAGGSILRWVCGVGRIFCSMLLTIFLT
ncbi:hypothetical protein BpHYR1_046609, partial [Brachionus plicatilis]